MKTFLISAFAYFALATNVVADPATGAWDISDKVSALDGSHEYIAALDADGPVANLIGRDEKPILSMSCTHQGLFFNINWPDFIDKDYDQSRVDLVWKLDDGAIQHSDWRATDQAVAQIGPNGLAWAKKWSAGKKLVVRVPDKHGGQEATFQLTGLDQVVAQVSQINCG